jgi:hypothetical protein
MLLHSGRRGSISSTASAGPSGNLYRSIDNYILANIAQWEAMEAAGRAFVVPQGSGCLTDVPTPEHSCTLAESCPSRLRSPVHAHSSTFWHRHPFFVVNVRFVANNKGSNNAHTTHAHPGIL